MTDALALLALLGAVVLLHVAVVFFVGWVGDFDSDFERR